MLESDAQREGDDAVVAACDAQAVRLLRPVGGVDVNNAQFTYDRVFGMDARQADVFQYGIRETGAGYVPC